MEELKLEYNHYKSVFKEYRVLYQLTIKALAGMRIFIKEEIEQDNFDEFDSDDMEQEMSDGEIDDNNEVAKVNDSGIVDNLISPRGERKGSRRDEAPYESLAVEDRQNGKNIFGGFDQPASV